MMLAWPEGVVGELSGTELVYEEILKPSGPAMILTQVIKAIFYLDFFFFVQLKM